MNESYNHYSDLPEGIVNIIAPPRIQTMMSAVLDARQDSSGRITLTYTDGSKESAASTTNIADPTVAFFAIVEEVQSKRT